MSMCSISQMKKHFLMVKLKVALYQKSPKQCAKSYPVHLIFKWIELRIKDSYLAHLGGYWSLSEKKSEIKPHLTNN